MIQDYEYKKGLTVTSITKDTEGHTKQTRIQQVSPIGWEQVTTVYIADDDTDIVFQYGDRFEVVLTAGTYQSGRMTIGRSGVVYKRDINMRFEPWTDKGDSATKLDEIPQNEPEFIEI